MQSSSAWIFLLCFPVMAFAQDSIITIGSKKFTESVILAELARQLIEQGGLDATHQRELGGTQFLWKALLAGDIDAYPEYTGTLLQEILAAESPAPDALPDPLARYGLRMTPPLGFNNTYALGMNREQADRLGIRTISDLRNYPNLRFGFSNEFMDRGDGWPGLRQAYRLPQQAVRGMDHDLSYRGLASGTVDLTDLYSTDAEIAYYDLRVLIDDRAYFPEYKAVFVYREGLAPAAIAALHRLAGTLPDSVMTALNARAKIDRIPEAQIAADFLNRRLGLTAQIEVRTVGRVERLWARTQEHLWLVLVSLLAAIVIAIPLGIAAARVRAVEQPILGIVGVIYTIPSLALLVFMIPLLGIGGPPAMVALFLYSLLPIVRNTHAGLKDIPPPLLESAEALGLSAWAQLWRIELPLASRSMLAGVQTSAVINIGTATLGALIGAGGYGQPILTGIRLDDTALILEGAIPAAGLALLAQGMFWLAERIMVPEGLRLG